MASFFNVFKSEFLSESKSIELYDPSVSKDREEIIKKQAYKIITNTFENIVNKSLQTYSPYQKYIKITNFIKTEKGTLYYRIPTDSFVRAVIWSQENIKYDNNNTRLFQNTIQFIINSDISRFFSNNLDFEKTCTFDLDYRIDHYKGDKRTVLISSAVANGKPILYYYNLERDKAFNTIFANMLIKKFETNCQIVIGNFSIFHNYFEDVSGTRKKVKSNSHAMILIAIKKDDYIFIYWYDPAGYSPKRPIDVFIEKFTENLNKTLGINTFIYMKSMQKIIDNNLQSLTDEYDIGMCQLFSLFWIHNVMMIMYNLQKQNNPYGKNIWLWIDNIDELLVGYMKNKLGVTDNNFDERKDEVYSSVYNVLTNFFVNVTNTMLEQKVGFYDDITLQNKLSDKQLKEYNEIPQKIISIQENVLLEDFSNIFRSTDIKTLNIIKKTLSDQCKNLEECRKLIQNFSIDEKKNFLIEYNKNTFRYYSLSQFLEQYLDDMIKDSESELDIIPSQEPRGTKIEIYKRFTKVQYPDEQNDLNIQAWKKRIDLTSSSVNKLTKKRISDIEKFAQTDITVSDIKSEFDSEAQMIYDMSDKVTELYNMYELLKKDLAKDPNLLKQVLELYEKKEAQKYFDQVKVNVNNFKKIYFKFPKKTDTVDKRLVNISTYFITKYLISVYGKNIPFEKDITFPKDFVNKIQTQIIRNIMEISDREANYYMERILNDSKENRSNLIKELEETYNLPTLLLKNIKFKINLKNCLEEFKQIYVNNKDIRTESAKETATNIFYFAKSKSLLSLYNFDALYNNTKYNYTHFYDVIKMIMDETKTNIKKLLFESCEVDEDCFSRCCVSDPILKGEKFCGKIEQCNSQKEKLKRKMILSDIDSTNILQTKRRKK